MVTDDTIIVTYPHVPDSDIHVGTTIGVPVNAVLNLKLIVLFSFGAKVIALDKLLSILKFQKY